VKATTSILPNEDMHRLQAAEGWLELGNHLEAHEELKRISPGYRLHPDVLEMRWRVSEAAKNWEKCLELAETLTDALPRRMSGWLKLAATLHAMGQSEDACQALVDVVDDFAESPIFLYNVACYSCQAGLLQDAVTWLDEVFKLDENGELKKLALHDPMLEPLRKRIGDLK
jgi:tetratricopeptide (TPR) repeat protein